MNDTKKSDLVFKLAFYMLIAKLDAERKNIERKQTRNGNAVQIVPGLNLNKMSDMHFYQIVYFYKFMLENENLTDYELKQILYTDCMPYAKRFTYLLKLFNKVSDFFKILKMLGPENFALMIVGNLNITESKEV
ncbi:MAG: hypothetical protein IKM43_01255 [Clostridia bacterium]|nr:hypothetical protein [Clostridia bacterium]